MGQIHLSLREEWLSSTQFYNRLGRREFLGLQSWYFIASIVRVHSHYVNTTWKMFFKLFFNKLFFFLTTSLL